MGRRSSGHSTFSATPRRGTWSVASAGDYNGDGKADILSHDASGALAIWEMHEHHCRRRRHRQSRRGVARAGVKPARPSRSLTHNRKTT
ncbi:MAG: FG-GAP repeat domain-containing protein [Caulobacterales bacterium]